MPGDAVAVDVGGAAVSSNFCTAGCDNKDERNEELMIECGRKLASKLSSE